MHALAEYVLRGRREAILMALLFTIIPLLGWVGVIIMALVTLRKGALEGFIIYAWIILPIVVLSIVMRDMGIVVYDAICGSFMVWISSIILRRTESWLLVIQASVIIAVVIICFLHLVNPQIDQWWITHLAKILQEYNSDAGGPLLTTQAIAAITWVAAFASGIQAAILLLTNLFNLAMARWVQSFMFNPGGLKIELYNLRIDNATVLLGVIFAIFAYFSGGMFEDCLPVIAIPFLLSGFSLMHYFAGNARWGWFWLACFYLSIVLLPYILGALIAMAVGDVWLNFRARYSAKSSK